MVRHNSIHSHGSSPVFQSIQQGVNPEHLECVTHQEGTEVYNGTIREFALHTFAETQLRTQDKSVDLRVVINEFMDLSSAHYIIGPIDNI